MTWHKREDIVKCHLCGYTAKAPRACRKCGSPKAKWRGAGTQKIEEAISAMFPAARIGRMDRDAMKRRDNYRRILGDFRRGKLDILVGTQMIAKGLDFPRVTLVGIIDADISLHMPDFRAAEKTYQLIVQVAGRAGRGEARGEVIVQTMTPEAAPIQYAKRDDMESFLEEELENRAEYGYPPSTRPDTPHIPFSQRGKARILRRKMGGGRRGENRRILLYPRAVPRPARKIRRLLQVAHLVLHAKRARGGGGNRKAAEGISDGRGCRGRARRGSDVDDVKFRNAAKQIAFRGV